MDNILLVIKRYINKICTTTSGMPHIKEIQNVLDELHRIGHSNDNSNAFPYYEVYFNTTVINCGVILTCTRMLNNAMVSGGENKYIDPVSFNRGFLNEHCTTLDRFLISDANQWIIYKEFIDRISAEMTLLLENIGNVPANMVEYYSGYIIKILHRTYNILRQL